MQHDKKINKVYYETNLNYRLRNICDHRGEEDKLCLGKSHLPWVWRMNRSSLTVEKYNLGWKKQSVLGNRVIGGSRVLKEWWEAQSYLIRMTRGKIFMELESGEGEEAN